MPTYVLGVSALFHDAAAVLLRDGVVVAAAQEERFTRVKHDAALPLRAAAHCLAEAGIGPGELDALVFYEKPLRKFQRILSSAVATFPRGWRSFPRSMHTWLGDKLWARNRLARAFHVPPARILFCEHHLSHAASAFFCSPHERAAVLTVDGVGEDATTGLWRGDGATLAPLGEIRFPHSLGLFYSAITAWLGFAVNEGEYKVMGLAAFGEPKLREQMGRLLRLDEHGGFSLDLDWFTFHWHPEESCSPRLAELLGPPRFPGTPFDPSDPACRHHADVAASAQAALEDALLHLARHARRLVDADALCLAGGVALNAVANGRLAREGPFRHLWVQPAAGDAGGALGAALWAWHVVMGKPRGPAIDRWDLGRGFSRDDVRATLDDLGARHTEPADPIDAAATDLAEGRVIGWFEGRDEWGPRALGQRSILADPRTVAMRERVNLAVKYREPFRPFAPAVREADAASFFDVPAPAAEPARAMLVTAAVRRPDVLPAVTHVDGSARVQVVTPGTPFDALLARFGAATGTPVLLNTSLNLKGDPMAGTPIDALAALHRSELDALYVEGLRVERPR